MAIEDWSSEAWASIRIEHRPVGGFLNLFRERGPSCTESATTASLLTWPNLNGASFEYPTPSAPTENFAEVFSMTNTPQFALPNTSVGSGNFGLVTGTYGGRRVMEFGMRITF